jgi:MoaD family protein
LLIGIPHQTHQTAQTTKNQPNAKRINPPTPFTSIGDVTLQVSVRFFTVLREITGKKEETLQFPQETATVAVALKTLANRYGKPFTDYVYDADTDNVKGFLQFFVNGQSTAAMKGIDSELHEEDVLAIVPPVGGG